MNGRPAAFCPESTRWSCRFQIGPAWAKIVSADQPRTCGEYPLNISVTSIKLGSAPHMRGIPREGPPAALPARISPAHAGNTRRIPKNQPKTTDQPRTCGEYASICVSV